MNKVFDRVSWIKMYRWPCNYIYFNGVFGYPNKAWFDGRGRQSVSKSSSIIFLHHFGCIPIRQVSRSIARSLGCIVYRISAGEVRCHCIKAFSIMISEKLYYCHSVCTRVLCNAYHLASWNGCNFMNRVCWGLWSISHRYLYKESRRERYQNGPGASENIRLFCFKKADLFCRVRSYFLVSVVLNRHSRCNIVL